MDDHNLSSGKRLLRKALIILKCLGWAVAKTLLTDTIATRITTFFAAAPLKEISTAMKRYPSEETAKAKVTTKAEQADLHNAANGDQNALLE